MAVVMPRPTVLQSFVTVLKIPPATDCWRRGREDMTYILGIW